VSRVYASLPLSGPQGHAGRELLRGADLALERAGGGAEIIALDSFGGLAVANAQRAIGDAGALAYLGDFHSADVLATAPLLGDAGLLAVAPVATFVALSGPTLVRLSPDDRMGARAIADWLVAAGVGELLVVHDHDESYGVPVGRMCAEAAGERGLEVRARPVWDSGGHPAGDLGSAGAVLYVGVAGSGAVDLWHELHAARPELWLLGSEGIAQDWLARALSASAAERSRFFVAQRASFGFYGYEAMSLILDSLGAGDRATVAAAARSTRHRESVLGRYSLDSDGLTTSTAYGRLAVVGGELVWDRG
jgi:ABC-type branched-subunit amino acid transport system substrate-binding protein